MKIRFGGLFGSSSFESTPLPLYTQGAPDQSDYISRLERRIANLRREITSVKAATSEAGYARLRQERDELRKALSFIGHSPKSDQMTAGELRAAARLHLERVAIPSERQDP